MELHFSIMSTRVPQVQEVETPLSDAEIDVHCLSYFAWQTEDDLKFVIFIYTLRFCVGKTRKKANMLQYRRSSTMLGDSSSPKTRETMSLA